ncbi:cytochrome P450 [Mycobacterium barrassiae]|uniref:cytochrome P450 family protein n=1 Tax=Mycobacterium barrassiae TaxID=319709 RepID=UPI002265F2A4|nr:cytochrome P450 [Mycobacterium barrassiae]MCV7298399.1 cytochrome P450 [Mycobacterium barrassiae]
MLRLGNSFIQNPHSLYEQLRREGPAHPVTMWGGVRVWLITRYDEARALLTDPRVSKDGPTASTLYPLGTDGSIGGVLGDNMLFKDPPDHTRLRRFVTAAFTAHAVKRLRPTIERTTEELLDAVARAHGTVDLMQALAQPLPVRVIGELLGVHAAKQHTFMSLVIPIFTSTDPRELRAAQIELTDLLRSIIAAKRSQPGDDIFSRLVHLRDEGDQLSEEELLGTAFLLIVAGYETTVNLIGNGVLALLQHPDQLDAVRADRTLLPAAVEEILRFESPLNTATVRFTAEPVDVGDVVIPAGQLVLIALQAANRDERRFVNADRFDIFRKNNRHIAFGHGIHFCVGAPLARVEGEVALDRLLTRFGDIRLAADAPLTYRPSTLMRGLQALPVTLRAYPRITDRTA